MRPDDDDLQKARVFFQEAVRMSHEQSQALDSLRNRATGLTAVLSVLMAIFVTSGVLDLSNRDNTVSFFLTVIGLVSGLIALTLVTSIGLGVTWHDNPMGYTNSEALELAASAGTDLDVHDRYRSSIPDVPFVPRVVAHYAERGSETEMLWEHGTYLQRYRSSNRVALAQRERLFTQAIVFVAVLVVCWSVVFAIAPKESQESEAARVDLVLSLSNQT